jgi:glycerol-3-phosphate acyltransferase PlsY|tara:strand:- start:565 stop:1167 length:603 start_codon:yes stop_codon:yes gene_type:complete
VSFLFIILSYLIGSINFAYLIAGSKNLDISSSGSGNPGTSNILRTLGKKYAVLVLLGDVLKGIIPILLFDQNLIIYGVAAVIGHIYPIFYKFKGGKGVATYLGVYIAFTIANPIGSELFENLYFLYLNIPTLALFYFIIIKISRVSAVASLTTVLISNSLLIYESNESIDKMLIAFVSVLIFLKHSDNIKRLIQGNENKF